ncbi:MAG: AAA family ATPase [Pseudonocardia sp.]
MIDEVQRVPDLILAIKHTVDLDPRPGRFLLTGSARLFALQ